MVLASAKRTVLVAMARTKSLKNKDKNTRYFHSLASFKKSRKCTKSLRGERGVVSHPSGVKQEFVKFFRKLYSKDKAICLKLQDFEGNKLSSDHARALEDMPSVEEVKNVVWACESSKSSGYDGFNIGLINNMFDTVTDDIIKVVSTFFESSYLPKSINTTWVALIPKVDGASDLFDCRPISMIGSIYKVISKIMALRLRKVLPSLVGETQTAFVAEMQILDGALIGNEIITWILK